MPKLRSRLDNKMDVAHKFNHRRSRVRTVALYVLIGVASVGVTVATSVAINTLMAPPPLQLFCLPLTLHGQLLGMMCRQVDVPEEKDSAPVPDAPPTAPQKT